MPSATTDRPRADGHARDGRADRRLFLRYRRDRDARTFEALVVRFLPFARSVANRYVASGVPWDNLQQIATVGLLKSIDRFDPERGAAFVTFAYPTVAGEVCRHLRDQTWAVRPPRPLQELAQRVAIVRAGMSDELGRRPSEEELAARLDLPSASLADALAVQRVRSAESLDMPVFEGGPDTLADIVGAEDPEFARVEQAVDVERLLRVLSERDRAIVRLRFMDDLTQEEIGRRLGISQVAVSRVLQSALQRLAEHADRAR